MDEILFIECVEDCLFSNDDDESMRDFCENICQEALEDIEEDIVPFKRSKEWA